MRKAIIILACVLCGVSLFNKNAFKKDISKLTVVQGIGVDLNDDGTYTVTLETINTENYSNSDGTASPVMNISVLKGKTVYSAIKSAYSSLGKTPVMSQNRVIVIGENLAKTNVMDSLDYFVRDAENFPSVLLVTVEGSAEKFFTSTTDDTSVLSRDIENIILTAEDDISVSSVNLCELVNRYNDVSKSFYMPIISVKKENEKPVVISKGTAIFKEGKITCKLDENETAILNFLCGKVENGALDIPYNDDTLSCSVIKSKTFRYINYKGEAPVFNIKITVKADLAEIENGITTLTDEKIKNIDFLAEQKLKADINSLIEKLNRENSDAVGLSRLIYIYYPQKFRQQNKNLNAIMTNSQYNIEVKFNIRRVGQDFSA